MLGRVALKIQHRIHHMLEHSGTCYRSLFGHMADDKNRNTEAFCQPAAKHQSILRTCDTLPGAALTGFIVHRLDGVNDDDLRLFLLDYLFNPIQVRLTEQLQRVRKIADPHRTHFDLA